MTDDPAHQPDRLAMLDEHGHRQFVIPAEVKGHFHRIKSQIHFVLIIFFLALPWIHIQERQFLLFNIPERRFHFFGIEMFAHDAPLIYFIILIFAVGLALVTALFGRVWCGWACPQTVFIEALYRRIERWTEGNYMARRKLRNEPWSLSKLLKVSAKWALYILVSSLISHSVIAYFTGSKELIDMISGPPSENFTYFVLVSVFTGILLFNFGWFREQFCVIMCPYGKFQSVLFDRQTVTVMYDQDRGEPRKGAAAPDGKKGDCVACNRCVQVCPTKIDIRNGIQLECIGCTACIDACDEIMAKVNKPKGLIRYKSTTSGPVRWFRSRILLYGGILTVSVIGFFVLLADLQPIRVEILRAKTTPYQIRSTEEGALVQNQFTLRIENHRHEVAQLRVTTDMDVKITIPENPVSINKDHKRDIPVFIETAASKLTAGHLDLHIQITDESTGQLISQKKITLLGPKH